MSEKHLLQRDCSYSEYRNKKSGSKMNLSKSIHELDKSVNNITVSKTSEVQSLQKQLHSLIRNRSSSINNDAKRPTEMKAFHKSTKNLKIQVVQRELKGKENCPIQQIQFAIGKNKQKTILLLNQTFEPIEEKCLFNQQDEACEKKEPQKILILNEKRINNTKKINTITNIKMAQSNVTAKKNNTNLKATINDLDDMQKHLQNGKINKKQQIKIKQPFNKQQPGGNKLLKIASQNKLLTIKQRNFRQSLHQNGSQNFQLSSISINVDIIKTERLVHQKPIPPILPTKMISMKQRQKLVSQLDSLKDIIKSNEISSENLSSIKLAIRNILPLLNK